MKRWLNKRVQRIRSSVTGSTNMEQVNGPDDCFGIKLCDIVILDQNKEDNPEKSEPPSWNTLELKGTITESQQDITCIDFSNTGDFISIGDNGGKITIYRRNPSTDNYELYTDIANHELGYVPYPIKQIEWLEQRNPSQLLLATNENLIKLWKLTEKDWEANREKFSSKGFADLWATGHGSLSNIKLPKIIKSQKPNPLVTQSQIFDKGHLYPIHSISLNSDQETFLSACGSRINLWNFHVAKEAFNLVNFTQVKPRVKDCITTASFHPSCCSCLAYGTFRGEIRLCDMRAKALCDSHSKMFRDSPSRFISKKSIFAEYYSAISDLQWSNSGRFLATRDFFNIKIWDIKMNKKPVEVWSIQQYVKPHLKQFYHGDRLCDSFKVKWKKDDNGIVTGGYNNFFSIIDRKNSHTSQKVQTYQAYQTPVSTTNSFQVSRFNPLFTNGKMTLDKKMRIRNVPTLAKTRMNFDTKIICHAWHPKQTETIVVGSGSNLLMYEQKK